MWCLLLSSRYEESMGRKKVLEDELNDLEGKLQRAEKLVTGTHTQAFKWSAGFEMLWAWHFAPLHTRAGH